MGPPEYKSLKIDTVSQNRLNVTKKSCNLDNIWGLGDSLSTSHKDLNRSFGLKVINICNKISFRARGHP